MGSWRSFDIPPKHPGSLVCINFPPFFLQNSPSWRKTLIFSSHPSLMLARPDVVNADNYVSSKMPHIQLRSHSEGPFNVGDFWSRGTETRCYEIQAFLFSQIGLMYRQIGPIIISMSYMMMDVFVFLFIFVIVYISFTMCTVYVYGVYDEDRQKQLSNKHQ